MIVTSRSNPKVKLARSLSDTRTRRSSGLAIIEGVRNISGAAETGTRFHSLVYDGQRIEFTTIDRLASTVSATNLDVVPVSSEVFASISRQNNPSGIAAIIYQNWKDLDTVVLSDGMYCVALYNIRDPGNLGTIIRTSEAVSSQGVILIDDCTDPYHPLALRAAAGSLFFQNLVRVKLEDLVRWKVEGGHRVVGASQSATEDYRAFDYPDPAVVLMGSERSGLPEAWGGVCDHTVKIPMSGHTESLNVSIAAGLLLYELFDRQRTRPGSDAR